MCDLSELSGVPTFVALPLSECLTESHPVLQLERFCDAGESLTRFCAALVIGAVRARRGELPERLRRQIRPEMERPTFGNWRFKLIVAREFLPAEDPAGFASFVDELLTQTGAAEPSVAPDANLVALRNRLAHAGGRSFKYAEEMLKIWRPRIERVATAAGDLRGAELWHHGADGGRRFRGDDPHGETSEAPPRVPQSDGHVWLVSDGVAVDLWPFCAFHPARMTTSAGVRAEAEGRLLAYVRVDDAYVLYTALGSGLPFAELPESLPGIRHLFGLQEPKLSSGPVDFEAEIRADALRFVGRSREVLDLKEALGRASRGVFWLGGRAGIGKSYLTARVAWLLGNDPRRLWRIAWRFRSDDHDRGNRLAFLRHAVVSLAARLDRPDVAPRPTADGLFVQLRELLGDASRARKVLFVIDGLDEVVGSDPKLPNLPFELDFPNVVWLCSGREEPELTQVFTPDRCTPVFEVGLGEMTPDDIREMLIDQTGSLRYDLLRRENPGDGEVNAAVQAVVARAAGLPLYVHLVVQDVLAGEVRFADLEHHLPKGLVDYYDVLLRRYAVSDLSSVLTPLVTLAAQARSPLEEETIVELLSFRGLNDRELVRQGLSAARGLLRTVAVGSSGRVGYAPAHDTVREHLRSAPTLRRNNAAAREAFVSLVRRWRALPPDHPAREYVFRQGAPTLAESQEFPLLAELARDGFVKATSEVLGESDALVQAREIVDHLATVRQREALAAYAEGYCDLAERVRNEPVDFERLFRRGEVNTALARIDAEADETLKAQLRLAASVHAREIGRDDLAARLRGLAEPLLKDLDDLSFARKCLIATLLEGPLVPPELRPAPGVSPDPSVRPRRWLNPWQILLLYGSSPYRGWWTVAGLFATVYWPVTLLIIFVLRLGRESIPKEGLVAVSAYTAAFVFTACVVGFLASLLGAARIGRRAFDELAEGLARDQSGATQRFARLCRLKTMMDDRGVSLNEGRLAALAVRQLRRTSTVGEAAEVLIHAAPTGDRVVEALASELRVRSDDDLSVLISQTVRRAGGARDPFAVALLLAPLAGHLGSNEPVGLLPFGELRAVLNAFRNSWAIVGLFRQSLFREKIGVHAATQRERAVSRLRQVPPTLLAGSLEALPSPDVSAFVSRALAWTMVKLVNRQLARLRRRGRCGPDLVPFECVLLAPVAHAPFWAWYLLIVPFAWPMVWAHRLTPEVGRSALRALPMLLLPPAVLAFADLGKPARLATDRASFAASLADRRKALLTSGGDFKRSSEHFCWRGFEETYLADVFLAEGPEPARETRAGPRVWSNTLHRLFSLGWLTPEQVTASVMEKRSLLRAVNSAPMIQDTARPLPTEEERQAQIRRICSLRPRWLRGACVTALACLVLLGGMHLSAWFAPVGASPPGWVLTVSLSLVFYFGLTHVWSPRRTLARLGLFGAFLYVLIRNASEPIPWFDGWLPADSDGSHNLLKTVWFLALVWYTPIFVIWLANHAIFTWRGSYILYPSPPELRRERVRAVTWLLGGCVIIATVTLAGLYAADGFVARSDLRRN